MRNWQGLVIGFLVAILTSVSAGVSMTKAPDANTIAVICQVEGHELAPEFADAVCPKLIDKLSELMPNNLVVERNTETANILCVVGIHVTLASENLAHAELSWANPDAWELGNKSRGGVVDYRTVDGGLNARMARNLIGGLFKSLDSLALSNCQ